MGFAVTSNSFYASFTHLGSDVRLAASAVALLSRSDV